ncbi:MAG: hypothetical protein R3E01_11215 [Pirellulaceae bacterium]|nr:hypothetical protein [Planctomycetales bacterium]
MDRKGPVPAGQKTSVGALELRACVVTPRPVVTVSASGNTQGFSHTRRVFSLQVVTTAVAIGRSVLATPDGVACCFMAFQYDNFVPLARLLDSWDPQIDDPVQFGGPRHKRNGFGSLPFRFR